MVSKETIDKHQFKITIGIAILVMMSTISCAYYIGTMVKQIEYNNERVNARIDHLSDKYVVIIDTVEDLKLTDSTFKIQMAEINVKLANIEAILIEFRQEFKNN